MLPIIPGKTPKTPISEQFGTESFFGGKIAQQDGVKFVGPATMADAKSETSVYYSN